MKFEDETKSVDCCSQTIGVSLVDAGMNTADVENPYNFKTVETELDIDNNGAIHPRKGEALVEMCVSHDVKSWDEIEKITTGL